MTPSLVSASFTTSPTGAAPSRRSTACSGRPGGSFYAEEVLRRFLVHPVWRRLLEHPQHDRFDAIELARGLEAAGLEPFATEDLWGSFAWFTARKPAA